MRAGARPSMSVIAGLDMVPAVPARCRWLPPTPDAPDSVWRHDRQPSLYWRPATPSLIGPP